jgi:hypothetical protein
MPTKIPLTDLPAHVREHAVHLEGEDVVFFDAPSFLLSHLTAVVSAVCVIGLSSWSIFAVSHSEAPATFHYLAIALLPLWAVLIAVLATRWKNSFVVITNRSVLFSTASSSRCECVGFRQIRNVVVLRNAWCSLQSGSAALTITTHSDESFTVTGLRQASRARDILLSSAIGALNINTPQKR